MRELDNIWLHFSLLKSVSPHPPGHKTPYQARPIYIFSGTSMSEVNVGLA